MSKDRLHCVSGNLGGRCMNKKCETLYSGILGMFCYNSDLTDHQCLNSALFFTAKRRVHSFYLCQPCPIPINAAQLTLSIGFKSACLNLPPLFLPHFFSLTIIQALFLDLFAHFVSDLCCEDSQLVSPPFHLWWTHYPAVSSHWMVYFSTRVLRRLMAFFLCVVKIIQLH